MQVVLGVLPNDSYWGSVEQLPGWGSKHQVAVRTWVLSTTLYQPLL